MFSLWLGSHRRNGNIARIVRMIERRMQDLAAQHAIALEFETLFLCDLDIHPCRGCRVCFDRGEDKCPLKDDIAGVRARMDAADGLLLASPVYVDDVSGLVKTWVDRLAYLCHRPGCGGKCAYVVATVGGSPTRHTLRTMNGALLTWGYHLAGQAGFKMGALATQDELKRHEARAARSAEVLFEAIRRQCALRPSFVSLLAFKIQQLAWQREGGDSYDVAYWLARGWPDPGCTFYTSHRAGGMKVALARAAGAAIARFVL